MTTTPAPTDIDTLAVLKQAASTLSNRPWTWADLAADRELAKLAAMLLDVAPALLDELAKTRAELDDADGALRRLGDQANHLVQRLDAAGMVRQRIADAHHKHVDGHGGTWGECNECGNSWPCPTYVWATTNRDPLATWDPADDDPTQPLAEANPATTAEPAAKADIIAEPPTQHFVDDADLALLAATEATAEPAETRPITARWPRIPGNDTVALHDCGGDPKCCGTPGDHDEAEPADEPKAKRRCAVENCDGTPLPADLVCDRHPACGECGGRAMHDLWCKTARARRLAGEPAVRP